VNQAVTVPRGSSSTNERTSSVGCQPIPRQIQLYIDITTYCLLRLNNLPEIAEHYLRPISAEWRYHETADRLG